jgi:hypothetical protein
MLPLGGMPERPNGAVLKTPIRDSGELSGEAAQRRQRRYRAKLP